MKTLKLDSSAFENWKLTISEGTDIDTVIQMHLSNGSKSLYQTVSPEDNIKEDILFLMSVIGVDSIKLEVLDGNNGYIINPTKNILKEKLPNKYFNFKHINKLLRK